MNANDLEIPAFFTTDGRDIWKLQSYCLEPTCELVNLETGRKEHFGLGGITAQAFKKIKMPIIEEDE